MPESPLLTVFTPTWNRAHLLARLRASLEAQQDAEPFEWILVDDGSDDTTPALLAAWQQNPPPGLTLRCFSQTRNHKKSAINRGARAARGELFLIIDSDDELLPGTVHWICTTWRALSATDRQETGGIFGLCTDRQGAPVSRPFPASPVRRSLQQLLFADRNPSDWVPVIRTDLLLACPFPEHVPGFVPEGLIWARIGRSHPFHCVNQPLSRVHLDARDSIIRNPVVSNQTEGRRLWYAGMLNGELHWFRAHPTAFLRLAANHVRFGLHAWQRGIRQGQEVRPGRAGAWLLVVAMAGPGLLLFVRDLWRELRFRRTRS